MISFSFVTFCLSIYSVAQSVKHDPREEIYCARCAAFDDSANSKCSWDNYLRFRLNWPGRHCYEGCIHIEGRITDEKNLPESWRRQLGLQLPQVFDRTPLGVPARRESVLPSAYNVNGRLAGRTSVFKVCANEVDLSYLLGFEGGCRDGVTIQGVTGTVCKCTWNYCNKDRLATLKSSIDSDGLPTDPIKKQYGWNAGANQWGGSVRDNIPRFD